MNDDVVRYGNGSSHFFDVAQLLLLLLLLISYSKYDMIAS